MTKEKFKSIVIVILAVSLAVCFAFIIVKNVFMKESSVMSSNETYAASVDPQKDTLPIGSIFSNDSGMWMVIGHKPVCYVDSEGTWANGECWSYDYYCVGWPEGCRAVYNEFEQTMLFNTSDIQEVKYVGLTNDTEKDYRQWVNNYDVTVNNSISSTVRASGPVFPNSQAVLEQQLRMQGKTSTEIYGTDLNGGELFSDILNNSLVFSNAEYLQIAKKQASK